MRVNHKVKFGLCVGILAILAILIGIFFGPGMNEKFAVFCWGGPLYIYLVLGRAFKEGQVFNIILGFVVFAGYLAVLLWPLYHLLKSFKWPLVIAQVGMLIIHFLIGWMIIR